MPIRAYDKTLLSWEEVLAMARERDVEHLLLHPPGHWRFKPYKVRGPPGLDRRYDAGDVEEVLNELRANCASDVERGLK